MLRLLNRKSEAVFCTVGILLIITVPFKLTTEERLGLAVAGLFCGSGVLLHQHLMNTLVTENEREREQSLGVHVHVQELPNTFKTLAAPLTVSQISQEGRSTLNVLAGENERHLEQALNTLAGENEREPLEDLWAESVQEPSAFEKWIS